MLQALLPRRDGGDETAIPLPDSLPMGIAVVRADGTLRQCNTVWRGWMDPRLPIHALARGSDRTRLAALIKTARQKPPTTPSPIEIHAADHRTAQVHAAPGENGDIVICILDATIRASLRSRMAQSQKMQAIGQLAGGIAHDFNNILTAIGGFCDILMLRHQHNPEFDDLRQIRLNTDRAAALVRQLLAFSRQQTMQPAILSLADVFSDAGRLMERLMETITLRQDHAPDLWPVRADRHQLEQVIINLAINARDAMTGQGTRQGVLSIRTRNITQPDPGDPHHAAMHPGDYVLCAVSDTGCGMTPAVTARIFEPFFSTKPFGQGVGQETRVGAGLGLATVHGIVKQTGGFIFVESLPGHGTTFRLYLPRHTGEHQTASPPPAAQTESTPASGTILLVEDDAIVRKVTARGLTMRGYTVLQADGGEQALTAIAARDAPVDLIISDVIMPGMSGPDLTAELRRRRCEAPVILMSGYAADAFRDSSNPGNDSGFLAKPFTLTQLTECVRQTLAAAEKADSAR